MELSLPPILMLFLLALLPLALSTRRGINFYSACLQTSLTFPLLARSSGPTPSTLLDHTMFSCFGYSRERCDFHYLVDVIVDRFPLAQFLFINVAINGYLLNHRWRLSELHGHSSGRTYYQGQLLMSFAISFFYFFSFLISMHLEDGPRGHR